MSNKASVEDFAAWRSLAGERATKDFKSLPEMAGGGIVVVPPAQAEKVAGRAGGIHRKTNKIFGTRSKYGHPMHKPATPRSAIFLALLLAAAFTTLGLTHAPQSLPTDPTPPDQPVKLIFIHHSSGENWLADENGGLGLALGQNNYFVSDTNYGWGPAYDESSTIGDHTDIPDWLAWFRSDRTEEYMQVLFTESGQNAAYTRDLTDPGGENVIILFKSCFPNSALEGSPDDPPDSDGWLTVGHAKYVYIEILKYFAAHPEKLFVAITAPPLQDGTYAANARAFNTWLIDDWLRDYPYANVAVFDFYNVLTGPDNHHRVLDGQIQHVFTPGRNTSYYPSGRDDDHPSKKGNRKATDEFIPLLNVFYRRWIAGQSGGPEAATAAPALEAPSPVPETPVPTSPADGSTCALFTLLPLGMAGVALAIRRR